MKSINTPFIRLCLIFAAGILTGFYIGISPHIILTITGIAFLVFLAAYLRAGKLFLQDMLFGSATFLLFFLTGILTTVLHLPENQPDHFINQIKTEEGAVREALLLVQIQEELKPDLYNRKFVAGVKRFNNKKTHGRTLLLFPKDSLAPDPEPGDLSIYIGDLQQIAAPMNPHQFNYRNFMENRGIFYQTRIVPENYRWVGSDSQLSGFAEKLRRRISNALREQKFSQQELAIIEALLLGQRQQISEETYFNYAAAGVIHILAISGLHVGIILFILHWILAPLAQIKGGKILRVVITILLLWSFAVLAGLSPSVVRAVTMFTFLAIALQMRRRTSAVNTLFLSLMVLLLVRPQNLFEVGFQLSYLAVLSIVLFQPLIYGLWEPRFKLMKYFWGLFSVTLAAQAGVLPLSLFYFHQFPGLFFLSNLVILPFLGIILGTGLLVMVLAALDILPSFLAEVLGGMIHTLNKFVHWVAQQEGFMFADIPFSGFQAMAFYFLLIALFLLLKSPGYKKIMALLATIAVLQLTFYYEKWSTSTKELIVFHKSRNTFIGKKEKQTLYLAHDAAADLMQINQITDYIVGERIENIKPAPLQNVYAFGEKTLLVVDSIGVYSIPDLAPDILLLSNSPRINLERLLVGYQPELIIADGSNYSSLVERWEKTAKQAEILFHFTATHGAFRLRSRD